MSERDILLSITDSSRDGISYSVAGHQREYIHKKKDEVIKVLKSLIFKLENDKYPFHVVESPFSQEEIDNLVLELYREDLRKAGWLDNVDETRANSISHLDDLSKGHYTKRACEVLKNRSKNIMV